MRRIAGVDLPADKRVVVALTYIYGIGRQTSERILKKTGISSDVRAKNLSDRRAPSPTRGDGCSGGTRR